MGPSKNDDRQAIGEPGAELSTVPWLTDPRYGGMSPRSAELSYRAAVKRLAEDSSVGAALPDYNEPPPPKSLAEYGLSPDAVTDQIVEHTTSSPT